MNRSFRLAAAVTLGMAFSLPVAAEGPGWSPNSTVLKIVTTYDGGINVLISPTPTNCISNSGYGPNYVSIYPNHPGINRIKADLLTAYLTGGAIAVYYANDKCTVNEVSLGGR